MLALLVISFLFLFILRYFLLNWKYFQLPTPGICLPLLGHMHIIFPGKKDPVNFFRNLYRKNNNGSGVLWVRKINIDFLYVGDFSLIKELFNHRYFLVVFIMKKCQLSQRIEI